MQQLSAVRSARDEETAPVRKGRSASPEPEGGEFDIAEVLSHLVEKWRLIAATASLLTALGVIYALIASPIYRADALLQVEEKSEGMGGLKDLSAMFVGETPAEAERELIRSRLVVASVVDQLRLDVQAEPRYFPVLGKALARLHGKATDLATPFLGLSMFAWGGERIRVERLDVPEELEKETLTFVAGERGHYALYGPDDELILEGEVGKPARSDVAAPDGEQHPDGVGLFVSEFRARPGTHFQLIKQPRAESIRDLQQELKIAERGKKTGIIALALDGPNRERIEDTVDKVMEVYLRQNVERKSAEAEKTLEFVSGQLPVLKENLEAAETALNAYRSETGSVDLGLEARAIIDRVAEAETKLTELELQSAALRQRFTDSHPTVEVLRKQISQLRAEKASVEGRWKHLPGTELTSARLMRDVQVANELYLLLLNKAQELRMVKSGTIGNVRIIDDAEVQIEHISPKRPVIAVVSLIVGALLGIGLAFAQRALNHGVEDPSQLEQELGLSVYASIPRSSAQAEIIRAEERAKKGSLEPLALRAPGDLAVESLRSLRTSLQFALAEVGTNVIAIGGPRPAIGKSFVSVNLAHVLADSGRRVVLVDGDMRKGQLHRYFGLERVAGLSELISGSIDLERTLNPTALANLSFIATGAVPANPAELLASTRYRQLVYELSQRFDLVLIDAPPILAVTDAVLIAQTAGVNLIVLKSGLHPMREVALAVSRLEQSGVKPNGFIVNAVEARTGFGASRFGYHYQYEYK